MTENEVRTLALKLLTLHGVHGWKIAFGNAVKQGGSCSYGTKTLRFSRVYLKALTPAGVRNLVTHEVAHAVAGEAANHGPQWQRIHRSMGGDGRRTVAASQIVNPGYIDAKRNNYVVCTKCLKVLGKTVRKYKTAGRTHRNCGGQVRNVHKSEIANA